MKHLLSLLALLLAALACDRIYYAELKAGSPADQPVFRIGTNPDFSGYARIYEISVSGRPRTAGRRPPAAGRPESRRQAVSGKRLAASGFPPSPDTSDNWHLFWEAKVDSGFVTSEVFEITYGIVPSRFHNTHAADSLPAGYIYAADFRCPGLWSPVYFEINSDANGRRSINSITEDQFNHARQ